MKNSKSILTATLCLVVICLVVTGAVAGTRYAFSDEIAAQEWQQQQTTMSKLIKAEDYQQLTNDDATNGQLYEAITAAGETAGFIAITAEYGYGSEVSVMTAITPAGQVAGIEILDASKETPGLGQNVTRSDFTKQFDNLTASPKVVKQKAADNEIQAITGATRSSNAVAGAVTKALALYEKEVG